MSRAGRVGGHRRYAQLDERAIAEGMAALAAVDADVKAAYAGLGPPDPRIRPEGFPSLLSIIVSQQLSIHAAAAIMARLIEEVGELTPEALLATDAGRLRSVGLSRQKVDYTNGLAEAVISGRLDLDGLLDMDDTEAIEVITSLRGFGRWSAEIYLMFALHRPDIFPAGDLALRKALGRLKRLPESPTEKESLELVAPWTPWRSVGALFLWHYYRGAPA